MELSSINQNKIVIGFFSVVSLFGLAWFMLRQFEDSNLYFPEKGIAVLPSDFGMPFEEVFLLTEDRKKICGWFIPASNRSQKPRSPDFKAYTILFCHGNAGNISHRMEKARLMTSLGLDVFLFDYRGYGRSKGSPSERGTYLDGTAAYAYLLDTRKVPADQIVFYGESLGAAVATELARRFQGAGLILESSFTSVVEMGKQIFPWLPVRWVVRNRYDNLAKIQQIKVPVLIMHSREDEMIPFKMAEELFAAARAPKEFFEMRGDHNGGYAMTKGYSQALSKFLLKLNGSI